MTFQTKTNHIYIRLIVKNKCDCKVPHRTVREARLTMKESKSRSKKSKKEKKSKEHREKKLERKDKKKKRKEEKKKVKLIKKQLAEEIKRNQVATKIDKESINETVVKEKDCGPPIRKLMSIKSSSSYHNDLFLISKTIFTNPRFNESW